MRLALIAVVLIAGACKPPEKPQPRAQTVATVVFRNVRVNAFDGIDVAVDEENIVLIGDDLTVTRSAVQIDGTGKTLVPAPVDIGASIELVDPTKLEEGIARAELYQKRPVVAVTTLAEARAAVEAGVDGLIGVVADAPLDEAFLQAAAQRGVFVIASLPAGETVPPEVINNVVAMRGKLPVIAGAGPEQLARLVNAGFLPEEAIDAATLIPAAVFGLEERGRIVEGFRADLLLVNGDPYEDITAMGRVAGEWRAGVSVSGGTE